MADKSDAYYMEKALVEIEIIIRYTKGLSYEEFMSDGRNIGTVIIPSSIDYIEGAAFNSSNVNKIIFGGTQSQWGKVIRYSGPIEDVSEIIFDSSYDY